LVDKVFIFYFQGAIVSETVTISEPQAEHSATWGKANFINPGRACDGYIAAEDGIHSALVFSFKPLNAIDVAAFREKVSKLGESDSLRATAKMIAERVVSWNVTVDGQEMLPVSADFALKMPAVLFSKLALIVEGFRANDLQPSAA
jgi:hypothetical protein